MIVDGLRFDYFPLYTVRITRRIPLRRTRSRYWAHSKLAVWLERRVGIIQPHALPWGEWDKYHADCRAKAPVTYWITHTLFDKAQVFLSWPADQLYRLTCFVKNLYGQTHALTGTLPMGQWCDLAYRMEHCIFGQFVKFIEVEKGLERLMWELTLTAECASQAESAAEQLAIYNWCTDVLPNRVDSYVASGLSAFNVGRELFAPMNEEDKAQWLALHEVQTAIDTKYSDEDEEMLIRLIKIRRTLWT